jgi:hypothetical protein
MKIERDNLTCLGRSKTKIRATAYWKRDFSLHYPINVFDTYNSIVFPDKYIPATTYTSMHDLNEFNRFESWTKNEIIEYTVRLLRLYNETKENSNE